MTSRVVKDLVDEEVKKRNRSGDVTAGRAVSLSVEGRRV